MIDYFIGGFLVGAQHFLDHIPFYVGWIVAAIVSIVVFLGALGILVGAYFIIFER